MAPILAFDIECVPDFDGIRKVHDLPRELDDRLVAEWYSQKRRSTSGNDFPPHYLQRVVAIACALRNDNGFRVWSIGEVEDSEPELIRRFFDGIEKLTPQLVSWNGSGFDLPVLQHRALICGACAARYWDWGDEDREFKFNNYLGRFHTRHIDLMDVLAGFQNRANAPLDAMARLCGFPGKLGMDGSQVYAAFKRGEIGAIRNYCETDVANTYLLFQRFQLIRGVLDAAGYEREVALFREWLSQQSSPHWKEFATAWR
jgi:predicted PolB exonuclease-like 3'-5' exonuclease